MDIVCPRCGSSADVDFYGPCPACRDELRATFAADPRATTTAGVVEYEPKMNVTPNAVALKDD